MTEDEAKTKWCSHAVASHTNPRAWREYDDEGRPVQKTFLHNCIASGCMAWRWIDTHVPDSDNPKGDLIRSTRTYGACGLAGPWFANYSRDHRDRLS